jgi:molybdopterin adenylyltransferase
MKIGILTISDRASAGPYEDISGPTIATWLENTISSKYEIVREIVADGVHVVAPALVTMVEVVGCGLILTTGGTGPTLRDQTPEAMKIVLTKELPGFGEIMRQASLADTPTAILSRQTAGVRGRCLIINLPGKPAINTCLQAVFPAVPYCLHLLGQDRVKVDLLAIECFWPTAQ